MKLADNKSSAVLLSHKIKVADGLILALHEKKLRHLHPRPRAILLIHSATFSSIPEYDLQVKDYSLMDFFAKTGYNVFALDIRGYGNSQSPPTGVWVTADLAESDVKSAVDFIRISLGVSSVDILGWSWGTQVAGLYAQNNPATVGKLVLYAPFWNGVNVPVPEPQATRQKNDREFIVSDFLDAACVDAEVVKTFVEQCLKYDETSPRGSWRDMRYLDKRPILEPEKLTMPTLVIYGEHDHLLLKDDINRFFDRLPAREKEMVIIPDTDHMAHLELNHGIFQTSVNAFLMKIRINQKRFSERFNALSKIGATPDGGVNRPAFSEAHFLARQWFLEEAVRAGLETQVDGAGNQSAILHCENRNGPTMLLGSHLDSVPYGGRFDGALGVVSALEVLETMKERNVSLRFNLEAIDFTDEEGRFADLFGSQAVTGTIKAEHLRNASTNKVFEGALRKAGLSEDSIFSAKRDPSNIAGYLELHIEQGSRLVDQNVEIGIVTSIVGIRTYKIRFIGRADHAGTTPMSKRLDAAQGASSFTLAIKQLVTANFPGTVATVGNMVFEPGASNVVPQTVTLSLEFRAGSEKELNNLGEALLKQASVEAEKFGLKIETKNVGSVVPAITDAGFQEAIANVSKALGLTHAYMPSGAGHDAQSMARICPTGMIFVPSQDGFSHSAMEFTKWEDCVNGANVLLNTVLNLNCESE